MSESDLDFLTRVPLFARLAREDLDGLAKAAQHLLFRTGEVIIREGEGDRKLFIVVRGRVEVVKSKGERSERRLAMLGPCEYFGEMALIDDLVRSATVVASEETEVLCLDHLDLYKEIGRNPSVALELLRTLSQRLRALEKILVNSLGGLLPICMNCKNIRDERGVWVRIEDYISNRSEAEFTHGICPDCMRKLYPKYFAHDGK
jgi:CRP-like cAMP-binding protein